MIDDSVRNRAEELRAFFEPLGTTIPLLALDGTWPSLGVLDAITHLVRGCEEPDSQARELLKDASAYIAIMAHDCWNTFEGVSADVRDDAEDGICIVASGGAFLADGKEQIVRVERDYQNLIVSPPQMMPVVGTFTRPVVYDSDLTQLYAVGLLTGTSQYGEGPWLRESLEALSEYIECAKRVMAVQSSVHYARVFPDEKWGQVAELYLNELVYPPLMMGDRPPGYSAVTQLFAFFEEYGVSPTAIARVVRNLGVGADDVMSPIGLTIAAALQNEIPTADVLLLFHSRSEYSSVLRPAMLHARELLGEDTDWIDGVGPEYDLRYQIERNLGFLPWLKFSETKIRARHSSEQLREIMRCLSFRLFDDAKKLLDGMISIEPANIECRLQRAYIDYVEGDVEQAEAAFRQILSEPDCETDAELFNYLGLCRAMLGDLEEARRHFENAFGLQARDPYLRAEIGNNYAWLLAFSGEFEKVLYVLDLIERGEQYFPFVSMVNRYDALKALDRDEEAKVVQRDLVSVAPLNRSVFKSMVVDPV